MSASASRTCSKIRSACETSAAPAGVGVTPRRPRTTSGAPVSASSRAIDCETADWVYDSDSAAAENDPRPTTSHRTWSRAKFSISKSYTADEQRY